MAWLLVNVFGPHACADCERVGLDRFACLDAGHVELDYLIERHQVSKPGDTPLGVLIWRLNLEGHGLEIVPGPGHPRHNDR